MRSFLTLSIAFVVLASIAGQCHGESQGQSGSVNSVLVTATMSSDQVRFSAFTFAKQIRLQVISQAGGLVYDSGFHPGNLLEWPMRDQQGSGLADGIYGCVVAVEDLYGQVSNRLGILQLQGGSAWFQKAWQSSLTTASVSEGQEISTILDSDEPLPMTLAMHDENGGLIESGQGRLDFHAGEYFSAKGNMVPHMRLTPEGNLGIGVAKPSAKLEVAGLIKASEGIQFSDGTILKMDHGNAVLVNSGISAAGGLTGGSGALNSGDTTGGAVALGNNVTRILATNGISGFTNSLTGTTNQIAKFTSGTEIGSAQLTEDGGGNVGIGTATPTAKLDVSKTGSDGEIFNFHGPSGVTGHVSQYSGYQYWTTDNGNMVLGSGTGNSVSLMTNNSIKMMVDPTGNIGIGTNTPSARLDVSKTGSDGEIFNFHGPSGVTGHVSQYSGYQYWTTDNGNMVLGSGTDNSVSLMTNNSVKMMVDPTGKVGIGTTVPTSKLTVEGNVQVSGSGNGIVFPDGSSMTSNSAARIRAITYLAGCDTCSVLADTDDQKTIFVNLIGGMTINSVTCYSDAGSPTINVQRDNGTSANILAGDLACSTSGVTSTSFSQSALNLNDQVHFVMVTAGGVAKRVTVILKTTVN
jgi:hypothetical protein